MFILCLLKIDATHAKRFITACYGDLDTVKRLIEHNYKL